MFCTRCGMENPNDGRFCTRCGAASEAPGTRPPSAALSADLRQAPSGPVETSRKAIGSLICGLLFFFIPTAIIAVVLGHLSLSEIRKSAGQIKGHGMAVAGLVLGYLGV